MDRTDRLINNRAPRRMLLLFVIFLLAAAGGSFLLATHLAEHILSGQIKAMLSVLGGGSFTAPPDPDAVATGEASLVQYGIHTGMEPRLMEGFAPLRMHLFWSIFLLSGGLGMLCLLLSLRQLRPIYRDLEEIRIECLRIAEGNAAIVGQHGEDFSCIRRVCDGINLIAVRMGHFSNRLWKEKQYLKEFLTDFSHQMKTSLAIIRLNSDMIADMESLPPEEKARLSDEILLHLDGMETLVISALKLAKLGADAVVYEMNEPDLAETCEDALRRISPLLRSKEIAVSVETEPEIVFLHDRTWLREAIENLLKNIADHSGCRKASLSIEGIPGAVKLTITDDGVGMEQSEIPRLFERFGKKSNNATMQSAGVGMAIAKKIIEAHRGGITVYSSPGAGTRFEILFLR